MVKQAFVSPHLQEYEELNYIYCLQTNSYINSWLLNTHIENLLRLKIEDSLISLRQLVATIKHFSYFIILVDILALCYAGELDSRVVDMSR